MKVISHKGVAYVFPEDDKLMYNEEFEKLLVVFEPLIQKMANKYKDNIPMYEQGDWHAVGAWILHETIKKHDPSRIKPGQTPRSFFSFLYEQLDRKLLNHCSVLNPVSKAQRNNRNPYSAWAITNPERITVEQQPRHGRYGVSEEHIKDDKTFDWGFFVDSLEDREEELVQAIVESDSAHEFKPDTCNAFKTIYKLNMKTVDVREAVGKLKRNAHLRRLVMNLVPNLS